MRLLKNALPCFTMATCRRKAQENATFISMRQVSYRHTSTVSSTKTNFILNQPSKHTFKLKSEDGFKWVVRQALYICYIYIHPT